MIRRKADKEAFWKKLVRYNNDDDDERTCGKTLVVRMTMTMTNKEENEEDEEMYGQGYEMLKRVGFQVGSGCGSEGQGSLRPVEAVEHGHHGVGWRSGAKGRKQ